MITISSASHWYLCNPNGFGIYVSISVLQMNGELNGLHVCHEAKMQAGWPKQVASLPLSRLPCLGKKGGVNFWFLPQLRVSSH